MTDKSWITPRDNSPPAPAIDSELVLIISDSTLSPLSGSPHIVTLSSSQAEAAHPQLDTNNEPSVGAEESRTMANMFAIQLL